MRGPLDDLLAEALRARGLATDAQVAAAQAEQARRAAEGGSAPFLGRILVEFGVMPEAALADVLRAHGWPDPAAGGATLVDAAPTPSAAPPTRPSVAAAPHDGAPNSATHAPVAAAFASTPAGDRPLGPAATLPPGGRPFGRYRLLAELGRGGMGVVWRALDADLRREVALKTVHLDGQATPESLDRLLREARTAATLDHPGIVPIHDVGVVDGIPYFAMALVHGRTLAETLARGALPGLRERAQAVHAAAEAVAHAHARRVIHRDLKPANLLVDEGGRVLVMDFGLARRMDESTRLTAVGQMLGTPQYMPPEQIEGELERVGPPADVYALGAVLYEALTGRPPFEGATVAELMAKTLSRDPVPPRSVDRRVPQDLETICLKALRKEPEHRYPSAREFADDLGRFLRGEAIDARRESWAGRAFRFARRRKVPTALALAALLAAVAALWLGAQAAVARREQARLDREHLTSLRTTAALAVDAVLIARRAGGRLEEAEARFVPTLREAVDRVVARAPELAEPHFYLGRLYRAVQRFPEAFEAQERALAKEPAHAPSLYELAVLRAVRFSTLLGEAHARDLARRGAAFAERTGRDRTLVFAPPRTTEELERNDAPLAEARREALAALERLREALAREPGWADHPEPLLRVTGAKRTCAEGLLAAHRAPDWESARRGLEAALAEDPRLEEAYEGLFAAARRFGLHEEAISACTRGAQADPGYTRHWLNRGAARMDLGLRKTGRGEDPERDYGEAIADFSRALDLEGRSVAAWAGRAVVRINLSTLFKQSGREWAAEVAAGLADFDRALELAPEDADARLGRGLAHLAGAEVVRQRGEDPEPHYAAAVADLTRATAAEPSNPQAWLRLCGVRLTWAQWRADRGGDPEEQFRAAREAIDRSLQLDPTDAEAWIRLGGLEVNRGVYRAEHGGDPEPAYAAALAAFDCAIEREPENADAWVERGMVHTNLAGRLRRRGADPWEAYARAIADLEQAAQLNSADPTVWSLLASTLMERGVTRERRGMEAEVDFAAALRHLDHALGLNPRDGEALLRRANLHYNRGVSGSGRGIDAEEEFRLALADYDRAVEVNPAETRAWAGRASMRANRGQHRESRGEDPTADYRAALADFDHALELDPDDADEWMNRGALRLNWSAWRGHRGEDPWPDHAAALADFDRALAIDPTGAERWLRRGVARANAGFFRADAGGDAAELYAGAIQDLGEALARDPTLARAWMTRAAVRGSVGLDRSGKGGDPVPEWTAALEDFGKALEHNPRDADAWHRRALLRLDWGDWEAQRGIDPRPRIREAAADLEAALRENPRREDATRTLEEARAAIRTIDEAERPDGWRGLLARAEIEIGAGRYDAAGTLFEEGLARQAAVAGGVEPAGRERETLAVAHYNFACVLARQADAAAEPEGAAALRDRAFGHLAATARLGWRDAAHLAQDADLAALHADPRWAALVKSMGE